MEKNMKTITVSEYLAKPYVRMITPDEGGGFIADILEFEGCYADGSTAARALKNLERVAESWIEARLDDNLFIPEPMGDIEMSGRFALRLPQNLHTKAALIAEREGVSLNTFLVGAIAASVGAQEVFERMLETWKNMITPITYP